ncbi:MAG: SPFH domain-containing protein [Planctomycetes bacterium]|nr:SPFH domain-containing protein [Planctomycetota bacterium]
MENTTSQEITLRPFSAWLLYLALPFMIFGWIVIVKLLPIHNEGPAIIGVFGVIFMILMTLIGSYVVGPNQSRALVLFGNYKGTVRKQGFFWTNPFTMKKKISLKANNIASEKIKVNDSNGSPIEIGAVVVWQVDNTAQALFDVEDYEDYIDVQIETAVRAVASAHPYDESEDSVENIISLRGDSNQVDDELQGLLSDRLERAGIAVLEARLSHLAYAPEIAQAMLQRQQAEAIISARKKIVEGAVSMVDQAITDLSSRDIIELDDERKATMVSNLLVVLCGQENASPVINTGSLYQ